MRNGTRLQRISVSHLERYNRSQLDRMVTAIKVAGIVLGLPISIVAIGLMIAR